MKLQIYKSYYFSIPKTTLHKKWKTSKRKLRIWSHLLKKPLMENFIFWAMSKNTQFNANSTHNSTRKTHNSTRNSHFVPVFFNYFFVANVNVWFLGTKQSEEPRNSLIKKQYFLLPWNCPGNILTGLVYRSGKLFFVKETWLFKPYPDGC